MNVRPAVETDLPALIEIYNHYVLYTSITFDTQPFSPEARRPWSIEHSALRRRVGFHRLPRSPRSDESIDRY